MIKGKGLLFALATLAAISIPMLDDLGHGAGHDSYRYGEEDNHIDLTDDELQKIRNMSGRERKRYMKNLRRENAKRNAKDARNSNR